MARADGPIKAVAIARNRWLVTGSEDETSRVCDLSAKDPAANPVVLRGHEGWDPVYAVPFSSGRGYLNVRRTDFRRCLLRSDIRMQQSGNKRPAAVLNFL